MKNNIFPGDPVYYVRKDGTYANQCFYIRCYRAAKTPSDTIVEVLDTEKRHQGVKRVPLACLVSREGPDWPDRADRCENCDKKAELYSYTEDRILLCNRCSVDLKKERNP